MFHDQYVLTNDMYLPFCSFFMSSPEPPMGISGVGSYLVWSGGSLIIFQLFRCRNLALNRFFPAFLRGRHVLYLGMSGCPYICTPHTFVHSLYVCTPSRGVGIPNVPILFCTSVCSQRLLHVVGVVRGPLHVGHLPYTPCMGVLPHMFYTPLISWLPCTSLCFGVIFM